MSQKISEDAIELLAIERIEAQGYDYHYGPDIASDGNAPERGSFDDVLLLARLEAGRVDRRGVDGRRLKFHANH